MTESVNWDADKNSAGVSYGNSFVNIYVPMLFNDSGEAQEKPPPRSSLSRTSRKIVLKLLPLQQVI